MRQLQAVPNFVRYRALTMQMVVVVDACFCKNLTTTALNSRHSNTDLPAGFPINPAQPAAAAGQSLSKLRLSCKMWSNYHAFYRACAMQRRVCVPVSLLSLRKRCLNFFNSPSSTGMQPLRRSERTISGRFVLHVGLLTTPVNWLPWRLKY